MSDLLDPSALLSTLSTLLPDGGVLRSPQDALAALTHAIFVAHSFILIGIEDSPTVSTFDHNKLSSQWNERGPNHYSLRYRHNRSSLQYLVTITKLSDRTLFHAIATERVASLDLKTEDYTSHSSFPRTARTADEPLVHGFISSNRVVDLASSVKLKIISVLMPDLGKGDNASGSQGSTSEIDPSRGSHPIPVQPYPHPSSTGPWQQPGPGVYPPDNPLSIGRRDLDPIPMNPFSPPSLFGGPSRDDGMFVGPDHPIFGNRRDPLRGGDGVGPWGGDGFLPPMGAPPGARFDPVIPGQPGRSWLGSNHNRGIRGDPSNDEFLPPGFDNDAHLPPPPGSRDMFM